MRTLVTGFGPFGSIKTNPSALLAESSGVPFQLLEVSYEAVDRWLADLDGSAFDTLLLMGVAGGRTTFCPELFARNRHGRQKDNSGQDAFGEVEPGGPVLISSTLWTPDVVAELAVTPGFRLSLDAGNYLCNHTLYRALRRFPEKRVGFLHVPPLEKMPIDAQQALLATTLRAIQA